MPKIFRVRKYLTGNLNGKKYVSYKYSNGGTDWTHTEIENDCEKIKFIFSKTMNQEDIDKVKAKWSHKLID